MTEAEKLLIDTILDNVTLDVLATIEEEARKEGSRGKIAKAKLQILRERMAPDMVTEAKRIWFDWANARHKHEAFLERSSVNRFILRMHEDEWRSEFLNGPGEE